MGQRVRADALQAARVQGSHLGTLVCFQQSEITEESGLDQAKVLLTFKRTQLLISGDCASPWRTGKSPRRLPRMPVNSGSENSLV